MLRELVDREGQTIVMVTRDPVAAAYADRVVFLVDGHVSDDLTGLSVERIAAWMAAARVSAARTDAAVGDRAEAASC